MAEEQNKKGVGISETAGGLVVGAAMAHMEGKFEAASDLHPDHIAHELTQAHEKAINAFKAANPMPRGGPAVTEWSENAGKAAKEAMRPIEDRFGKLANPFTRPFVVFKEASPVGKTVLGAIVISTALGAAWGINKWRNRNVTEPENAEKLTHVQNESYRRLGNQLSQHAGQVQGQAR